MRPRTDVEPPGANAIVGLKPDPTRPSPLEPAGARRREIDPVQQERMGLIHFEIFTNAIVDRGSGTPEPPSEEDLIQLTK